MENILKTIKISDKLIKIVFLMVKSLIKSIINCKLKDPYFGFKFKKRKTILNKCDYFVKMAITKELSII